jgi:hypothetical protein
MLVFFRGRLLMAMQPSTQTDFKTIDQQYISQVKIYIKQSSINKMGYCTHMYYFFYF